MIQYRIQRNYSWKSKLIPQGNKEWITRKLRQLQDFKLLSRFKKIFPKSYEILKGIKNKIRL